MKTKHFLITSTFISVLFLLSACYKNNNNNYSAPSNTKVTISSSGYSPASLTVVMGSTVTWTNNDNTAHTVTTTDGSISSGDIVAGSSYSKTFSTAGTYNYYDAHSISMMGVLIVSAMSSGGGY
jgi:plastocyanin